MSTNSWIFFTISAAGILSVATFIWLILVPAWGSYRVLWQRAAAAFLSVYVLAASVMVGLGVAGTLIWFYDRL